MNQFLGCLRKIVAVTAVLIIVGINNIVVAQLVSLINSLILVLPSWSRGWVRAQLALVSAVLCGVYSAFIRHFKHPTTHVHTKDDSLRVFQRASATQEPSMAEQEKKSPQVFFAAPLNPRPAKFQSRVEKRQNDTFAPSSGPFRGMERERMISGTPLKRMKDRDIRTLIPERFWRNIDGEVSAPSAPQSPEALKQYSSVLPQKCTPFVAQRISIKETQPTTSRLINRPIVVPAPVVTAHEWSPRINVFASRRFDLPDPLSGCDSSDEWDSDVAPTPAAAASVLINSIESASSSDEETSQDDRDHLLHVETAEQIYDSYENHFGARLSSAWEQQPSSFEPAFSHSTNFEVEDDPMDVCSPLFEMNVNSPIHATVVQQLDDSVAFDDEMEMDPMEGISEDGAVAVDVEMEMDPMEETTEDDSVAVDEEMEMDPMEDEVETHLIDDLVQLMQRLPPLSAPSVNPAAVLVQREQQQIDSQRNERIASVWQSAFRAGLTAPPPPPPLPPAEAPTSDDESSDDDDDDDEQVERRVVFYDYYYADGTVAAGEDESDLDGAWAALQDALPDLPDID